MALIEIKVEDAQEGDVWQGLDPVRFDKVDFEGGVTVEVVADYQASHRTNQPTVNMKLVRLHGRILSGDDQGTESWWSLRPDQVIEVDRG
jgi:hypothetical protein